ncbi:MAG: hypothetical protein AAGE92_07165 [Cyanobacteria bacterium P01_G01_bin.4]
MTPFNTALLIAEPFIQAASISAKATKTAAAHAIHLAKATAKTLTSEEAVMVYEALWLLCQLAFWLTLLAGACTIQAGRAFRRYYEAEWANAEDIQWLIKQYQTWKAAPAESVPDLGADLEPESLTAEIDQVLSKPAPVASVAQAIAEPVLVLSVPAESEAEPAEVGLLTQSITEQEQAIVDASSSTTNKLRQLARLHGIPRKAGKKYRRNPDLRAALQPLISVVLP